MAESKHQIEFTFNPVVVPQADGSFLIRPGKPVPGRAKLSIMDAAKKTGLSKATIYRLYDSGLIQGERPSPKKIWIYLDSLQAHLEKCGDPEVWTPEMREQFSKAI
jgi:excisionase family DNA binding protein